MLLINLIFVFTVDMVIQSTIQPQPSDNTKHHVF